MDKKIGFIGLGTMGKPMAKNLYEEFGELIVWNRTESKADELRNMGAEWGVSPKEVAEKTDVIITIVRDTEAVKDVVIRESGVIEGIDKGSILIDMSTISPQETREIAEKVREKGADMLDAPVSGGDIGAEEGTLSIMAGGSEETFEECKPILEVLGEEINYLGESGMGQTAKLCNQVVCGLNILATCEGIMLGQEAGLDIDKLLEAITGGAAGSWMLRNLGPKMAEKDYEPGFKVNLQQKDLKMSLDHAEELDLPLPGTGLVSKLFRSVQAHEEGEEGTQSLIKTIQRLAGKKRDGGSCQ
ncbi:6-phosphogluconate dehydrogenase [candidate division MSBL1 archaeon SCGC-AAA259A05]|uniref:6-phosphogluconate dehydrogenase n=1 Tax=candidate division MSBL1 archaeon SCGC-AAA259A05 TaxID=1698259 RepID=A0A133U3G4_9EURY|nr:6-phosphogluconate dehydrogenase [candidate division MSBL1 archaeon SCGC-AAA259A05]